MSAPSPSSAGSRSIIGLAAIILIGLVFAGAGALAQGGEAPPPETTPGWFGVSGPELGAIDDPAAAPGYRLLVSEVVFDPGAYSTRHTHPSAGIVCVVSGEWGIMIHGGAATVTRPERGDTPQSTEPLELNTEVVLEPRDCVAMDEIANRTEHTVWNASDGETVLWTTDLYDPAVLRFPQ